MSGLLFDLLGDSAASHARRPALLYAQERVTFAELDASSARFAGFLRSRGVGPGDRVGLVLPNEPEAVAAHYGVWRLGAVAVPLNPLLRGGEIAERVADAGARALFAPAERTAELASAPGMAGVDLLDPHAADAAEPVSEVERSDPGATALLLYTSGTTGGPKGAAHSHAGLRASVLFQAGTLLRLTPDDVVFGAAPLAHVFGQAVVMNATISAGACVELVTRFEAGAALDLVLEHGISVFLGVPTMCIALLRAADSAPVVPRLRVAHVGGAPLPVATLEEFTSRFGCPVLEGFGMTETGVATTHRIGEVCKPGSVGPPIDGAEIRIVDDDGQELGVGEVGEVLFRGPGLMLGYWREGAPTKEAFDSEGWFATGDVGYVDEDGYLFLVDRKKDIVLRGGYNVYPREVEDVLYEHPAVLEAAVVGVPDELLGEEVVAVVVPRSGATCDPEELRAFVRERVAPYKYPRVVLVAETLPRGPSGKILKRELDRAALRTALDDRLAAEADRR